MARFAMASDGLLVLDDPTGPRLVPLTKFEIFVFAVVNVLGLRSTGKRQRGLQGLLRSVAQVEREIGRWKQRTETALRKQPMDARLRPFALAVGRLLALDVLRHPLLPEDK